MYDKEVGRNVKLRSNLKYQRNPTKDPAADCFEGWEDSLDLYSQQNLKKYHKIYSQVIQFSHPFKFNKIPCHPSFIPIQIADSTIIRNPKSFAHLILAVFVLTRPSGAALLRLPDAGGSEAAKSRSHSGYSESPMVPTSAGSHFYSERRGDGGWLLGCWALGLK